MTWNVSGFPHLGQRSGHPCSHFTTLCPGLSASVHEKTLRPEFLSLTLVRSHRIPSLHPYSQADPGRPETSYGRRRLERGTRVRDDKPGFWIKSLVDVITLADARRHPREDLAPLYCRIWNAELYMRSIKHTLRVYVLRCRMPAMVRKETRGYLLADNLIRGLRGGQRGGPSAVYPTGGEADPGGIRGALCRSTPGAVESLIDVASRATASHRVGDRPDNAEPRVEKRSPKAYRRMHEPRRKARRRLLRVA